MIQGIIFDLDGSVIDNEGEWEAAFQAVITDNQLSVSSWMPNGWMHEPGIGLEANWRKLTGGDKVDALVRQTRGKYLNILSESGGVKVRDGLVYLVETVKDWGWQTALATSGEWHRVERELEQLDLYLAFDVTTTGEEVVSQKPDPEIYLLTAQKLGLDPSECVVVEDSLAGLKAAVEAGTVAVGIAGDYATEREMRKRGAKLVVDNLNDVVVGLAEYGEQSQESSQKI